MLTGQVSAVTQSFDLDTAFNTTNTYSLYKVVVANASGATRTININSADDSFTYITLVVPDGTTLDTECGFIADKGINIAAINAGVFVTLFRTNQPT